MMKIISILLSRDIWVTLRTPSHVICNTVFIPPTLALDMQLIDPSMTVAIFFAVLFPGLYKVKRVKL